MLPNFERLQAILIDFDGTLVNSMPLLYAVYRDFLRGFGIEGNWEEFESLIGATIDETVENLSEKYALGLSKDVLLTEYRSLLDEYYREAHLFHGVKEFLARAKDAGLKVGLVTAAEKAPVETILDRQQIRNYFDVLVTAEDGLHGKPHPDLYLKGLHSFGVPPEQAVAIEDSLNGVLAAVRAGITTIWLTHKRKQVEHAFNHPLIIYAGDWNDILTMDAYRTLPLSDTFRIEVINNGENELSDDLQKQIDDIWSWEQSHRSHPLFNGRILSLVAWKQESVVGRFVEYKQFLAQLREPSLSEVLSIQPLCLSCFTMASDHILIGRRSSRVTQYPGYYELVPSGGFGPEACIGWHVDIAKQLAQELYEEAAISPSQIQHVKPFALVHDVQSHTFEVCVAVQLDTAVLQNAWKSSEYDEILWIPREFITEFINEHKQEFVPLSLYLLRIKGG